MRTQDHPATPYRQPPWIMRRVVDPLTVLLVGRLGIDDHNGTRVLEVKGRKSGKWHATPVRLVEMNNQRYIIAMYGETNWVKNLRAEGSGRLRMGSHVAEFRAVEFAGAEKLAPLRAYMKRYWSLIAGITTVTSPDAPDEELAKAASMHPVFQLQ